MNALYVFLGGGAGSVALGISAVALIIVGIVGLKLAK